MAATRSPIFTTPTPATDDFIVITRNMYNTMTRVETLTGVELDFGTRGTLVVDGWHLADVGRSDFLFS